MYGIQPPVVPEEAAPAGRGLRGLCPAEPVEIIDVVEIPTATRLAARVYRVLDIRAELVARIKAQIADGTYETPERLDIAVDRLMEELFVVDV